MERVERPHKIRKDQQAKFSVVQARDLGKRRDLPNPANPGVIRKVSDEYREGPNVGSIRRVMREFEELTGRKIITRLEEKWMGLLPDDPPPPNTNDADDNANRLVRELNQTVGRLVVRRLYTKTGIGLVVIDPKRYSNILHSLRKYDLEQSGGPNHDGDNNRLIWVRDSRTHEEYNAPSFESIYMNVTQSGKYLFETVSDLRDYLVNRATQDGIEGSRMEFEIEIDRYFRTNPPLPSTFRNIEFGSDEHLIVEGAGGKE